MSRESIDFLKKIIPTGYWALTAINPAGKGIITKTFSAEIESEAAKFITENNGKWNLYYHVNQPLKPLSKKAAREDIATLNFLHVDIDPRDKFDHSQEKDRMFGLLYDNRPAGIPAPTAIIDSGNGYQALWAVKNPPLINGNIELAEQYKLYNKQIENVFAADNCHNLDRLLRLPGTENIPDAKKQTKGRKQVKAYLVEFNATKIYDLEQFKPYEEKSPNNISHNTKKISICADAERLDDIDDLNKWDVPDRVKVVIVQGRDPDNPKEGDTSRSAWVFDCTCNLVRFNVPNEIIYGILTDSRFAISESILEQKSGAEKYAIRQIERAKEAVALDEMDFERNDKGIPIKSIDNILLAFKKENIELTYDEFAKRRYISGVAGMGPILHDDAIARLFIDIQSKHGLVVGKELFWMVLCDAARRNSYHPIKDYLLNQQWDGIARIDNWLVKYAGAKNTPYVLAVSSITLIAAVRRILHPGCKFDEMLILEGKQGTNKSTALKVLAVHEDWFVDDLPLNGGTQRLMEAMQGRWIIEAGELSGMRKAEVETLKAFVTRTTDVARMAYDRIKTEQPRECIFIGTTNKERYLADNTGNRRFWPIKIDAFDIKALKRDRNQLWAEAIVREAAGESIRLDKSLWEEAQLEQDARRTEDPFLQVLSERLDHMRGKIRAEDVWNILSIAPGYRTQEHNIRVGDAMRELGWTRTKRRFGGQPEYCYEKGSPEEKQKNIITVTEDGNAMCGEVPF